MGTITYRALGRAKDPRIPGRSGSSKARRGLASVCSNLAVGGPSVATGSCGETTTSIYITTAVWAPSCEYADSPRAPPYTEKLIESGRPYASACLRLSRSRLVVACVLGRSGTQQHPSNRARSSAMTKKRWCCPLRLEVHTCVARHEPLR